MRLASLFIVRSSCVLAIAFFVMLPVARPELALSHVVAGATIEYEVVRGDTLAAISARFGIESRTLAARNGLKRGGALRPPLRLQIDAIHIWPDLDPDISLLLNVPQRLLFVDAGEYVDAVPVAVGRPGWQTPLGPFVVEVKEEHPTWDVPVSIQREMARQGKPPVARVPPSPENPLGDYWLGLSLPGVGIHGTNAPESIYGFVTHGCIRVHPSRIRAVFESVEPGVKGRAIYEPLLVATRGNLVFVEAHPDVYRRAPQGAEALRALAARERLTDRIDWALADAVIRAREGVAVDVTRRNSASIADFR